MTQSRLKEFEALRGLSILLLMALHSEIFDPFIFGERLSNLAGMVASFLLGSFFFLAGYFTEFSLRKPQKNAWNFFWSKFIRIYPPYWMALLLFIFVLGYSLKRPDLLAYILNLQAVFSPVFIKPLLTLWYISMLVVFYFIFGGLMFSTRSSLTLLIASTVIYAAALFVHLTWGFFDPRFFQYYFIFLAGVFFCRFESFRIWVFQSNVLVRMLPAIPGVLLMDWATRAGYPATNIVYLLSADYFILSWALLWLTIFRTGLGGWRLWAWLSTASFFTYLIHRPIWRIIDNYFNLEPGLNTVLIHLVPGAMIALVFGYFLQTGYDRLLAALRLK